MHIQERRALSTKVDEFLSQIAEIKKERDWANSEHDETVAKLSQSISDAHQLEVDSISRMIHNLNVQH